MKHHKVKPKLGRVRSQRKALLRTLAVSLIRHERIETTEAKAKALRPFIERLVTLARRNDLAARRLVISRLGTNADLGKLFDQIAPRMKDRPGGYTRVVKLPPRAGDAACKAIIEFV